MLKQEEGAWPSGSEGSLSYPVEGSFHYQEPHRTMANHLGPLPPDYGPVHHPQVPLSSYSVPPQYGPLSPHNGPLRHSPLSPDYDPPHRSPPSPHFPEDHSFHPGSQSYYKYGPLHGGGFHPHDSSYQHEESEFGKEEETEDEDKEEEKDEESVILNSLEEALQEFTVQLPRLAVTAPSSVLSPKGEGVCRLPNLGNTCYLNAVLQCLYHTPGLPAHLAKACKELGDEDKGRNSVANSLNSLMTKMDDVKKLKKGVLAYFKGLCGLRDEQFAGAEQQEAHDLLAGLMLWLHEDLASQEDVDCACTKSFMKNRSAAITTTTTDRTDSKKKHHSTRGTTKNHHHQQQQEKRPQNQPTQQNGYQYRPPSSQNYIPNYDNYTGSTHNYIHHIQPSYSYGINHSQQPQHSLGNNHNYDHNNQPQVSFGTDHNHHPQYSYSYNQNHQLINNHYYHHQQQYWEDHKGPSDHYHNNRHHHQGKWDHPQPSDHHQNSSKDQQAPKKTSKALPQLKGGEEGEICGQCGVTFQRRSLISDIFEGIQQQDIICPKGGIILNTTWERFTSLSIPVSGSSETTLEEVLQHYFRISTLMWDCEFCGSSHPCHQQVRIFCAPPILILHLSRNTSRRNPRKQSVIFPIDGLSLQDHMKSTRDRVKVQHYDLYGVCNHHGTRQQGHYTTCCKTNKDKLGIWYDFDDEEVSKGTHFRHPREAHILFYNAHGYEAMHP